MMTVGLGLFEDSLMKDESNFGFKNGRHPKIEKGRHYYFGPLAPRIGLSRTSFIIEDGERSWK